MEKIIEYIREFFVMERGALIKNPMKETYLDSEIIIRRIGLKHIVESRGEDHYSMAQIENMILRIPEVFFDPEFDIKNSNPKYEGSRIVGKLYEEENRGLMVIHQLDDRGIKCVYNAYYRPRGRFLKTK
jgi:hypothetical protein